METRESPFSETGTMVGSQNLLLSGLTFFVFCKLLCKGKKVVSNAAAVCVDFGGVVWTVHGLHSRQPAGLFLLLLFVTTSSYHRDCAMHGGGAEFSTTSGLRIKALFIVLLVRSSL